MKICREEICPACGSPNTRKILEIEQRELHKRGGVMKIWIVADDEGTEVEAGSLEEALEEYVRSWWAGRRDDWPGRRTRIVAREIVDQCSACGEPLSDRDEVIPGAYVYRCPCGEETYAECLSQPYWVPVSAPAS